VSVLDRDLPANCYLALSGSANRVQFVRGDVCTLEDVRGALERPRIETVFHLAAQPIVPLSVAKPLDTMLTNCMGTYVLCEAVWTAGRPIRLVFASSGAYYGSTSTERPLTEDEAPVPASNIYAPSKVAADIAVRCYAATYGVKAVVCRFINTYGPGDTNLSRIVPRAIRNLILREPYDFGSRDDGTTRLDYMHVRDMAGAYLAAAEHLDGVTGEAFNFGGGQLVSTRELALLISRLFDGREREPAFSGAPKSTPGVKRLDINKAKRLLGWEPTTPLADGLTQTISWYRDNWERVFQP
jgi:CDP-glucose 4,6-dehydratase